MNQNIQTPSNEGELDTLSLILNTENTHQLKDIIIDMPYVAVDNDYHLLTLACWCSNYDIVDFLIQDHNYLYNALNNPAFNEHFIGLKSFNRENYLLINQRFEAILLEYYLLNNIPPKDYTEIQKY